MNQNKAKLHWNQLGETKYERLSAARSHQYL